MLKTRRVILGLVMIAILAWVRWGLQELSRPPSLAARYQLHNRTARFFERVGGERKPASAQSQPTEGRQSPTPAQPADKKVG